MEPDENEPPKVEVETDDGLAAEPLTWRDARRAACQTLVALPCAFLAQLPLWGLRARLPSLLISALLLGALALLLGHALRRARGRWKVLVVAAFTFASALVVFGIELHQRCLRALWAGQSLSEALNGLELEILRLLYVEGTQTPAASWDRFLVLATAVVLCLGCAWYRRPPTWRRSSAMLGVWLGAVPALALASYARTWLWKGHFNFLPQLPNVIFFSAVVIALLTLFALPFAGAVWATLRLGEELERRLWPATHED